MHLPHVVVVSLGYPPMRHVAGTRAHRMSVELARIGHRVSVVTVDWRPERGGDVLVEDGVRVIRIDPRRWHPGFDPETRPVTLEGPPPIPPVRRARTALRMLRWGPFAPWGRAAIERLLALHGRDHVDVVWAIHGEATSHEIAFRFSRQTGTPWVADYKDPWDLFSLGRIARLGQYAATRRRLNTCHALTETARGQAIADSARFRKHAHVIWSGYDAQLMEAATPARASSAFSLVYVGHLSVQHDRASIGRCLSAVRARSKGPSLELHLYGHPSEEFMRILAEHGVRDLAIQHSFVGQYEAYGLMKGADALLLLPATHLAPSGASVGVKELEYFASGSPVLCLGGLLPEVGAIASKLPQTLLAPTSDDAASNICELMLAHQHGTRPSRGLVNDPVVAAHAWDSKARLLSSVLTEAAAVR